MKKQIIHIANFATINVIKKLELSSLSGYETILFYNSINQDEFLDTILNFSTYSNYSVLKQKVLRYPKAILHIHTSIMDLELLEEIIKLNLPNKKIWEIGNSLSNKEA